MNALPVSIPSPDPAGQASAPVETLFVLNNLSTGGSELKVVRLANELHRRGRRIGICYLNEPHALRELVDPQVPVWCLERQGKFSAAALAALRRLLAERHVRNAVAVNSYPSLYVAAATRWWRMRPRTLVLMNTTEYPQGQEWRRVLYRSVLGCMDRVVFGSDAQRARWLRTDAPLRRKSRVVYNGVDTDRFQRNLLGHGLSSRRFLGVDEHAYLIGSVGRLSPEKNQTVLIDAVAALRRRSIDAQLVLAGDGPDRDVLKRKAAQLGIDAAVKFVGTLQDVRPLLAALDVFVLPSLNETFSNAALEAMAMGKAVVLTRTGGGPEMVTDGSEGFIVGLTQMLPDLVTVLERLYIDPAMRAHMGEAARARVLRDFSWQAMVDAYECLLTPEGEWVDA